MKEKGFEIAVIGAGAVGKILADVLHMPPGNVVVMAEEEKDKAALRQEKKFIIKAAPAVYEWRPPLSRSERRKQERECIKKQSHGNTKKLQTDKKNRNAR